MAEYIEREALLGSIGLTQLHFVAHGDNKSLYDIINEQPAADVAPVVRCKECKHWHEELGWCDKHSHFVDADGEFCHPWESAEWKVFAGDYFCKDGERRSDNA